MSLRADVANGLLKLSDAPRGRVLALDETGYCSIPLAAPVVAGSRSGKSLTIDVQVARTGSRFTLSSLLALMAPEVSTPFLAALLNRQFYSNQTGGMSYAINAERNSLLIVYHWILPNIAPEQFEALFQAFALATLEQLHEIANLSSLEPSLRTLSQPP